MKTSGLIGFPVILLLVLVNFACTSGDNQPLLPTISGMPGDLIIVINKAELDTRIGDEFRRVFEEPYQVLPQYEPVFDVIQVPHNAFGNVMKSQRNIIIVDLSPKYQESKIIVQKDIWAKPQLVLNMNARDDDAFIRLFKDNEKRIINLLENIERQRLMDTYKKNLDGKILETLKHKYHLSLLIPKGYQIKQEADDFVWIGQDVSTSILGVLVYQYEYSDTNTFTKEYLIKMRNRYAGKYVPGEIEGSYMITEQEYGPFFSQYKLRGERYVAELRGLWKMEKGISMGGPFVSITTLDEKRNKIVTAEGFVFAAGQKKRNYLRQVEAIVLSLEIP
ncbi:MAG: DUF4837 family protein [Bacteroidales bacterium]|nr:DUF4837 family protein [Bacteroidales bacterium]